MTKTREQSLKSGKYVWVLFAILIAALYLFGLTIPLVGPDEPRYAQIAREMFERGDFITPQLGGFDWFEKPALLYWLEIASFKLFGVSEFSARFGSALFGLGTVFSLWILGRKCGRGEADADTAARTSDLANWLGLIAASCIGLMAFSRGASFDIVITFPITASLVSFFLFDRTGPNEQFAAYLRLAAFYFFIGLALIAKGLIGMVFPFAIVAFFFVLSAKLPTRAFVVSLTWGTALSLLVAGAWYLPMYQANGWKFIDEFFIQHHFQRYVSNKYQHPQPFWFFAAVLPLMTIPWLPFFAASVWDFIRKSFRHKESRSTEDQAPVAGRTFFLLPMSTRDPLLVFALSWILVPLVFFSFSGSKLPGYILPALPAACIFTADYIDKFAKKAAWRRIVLHAAALMTLAVVAFLLQFVVPPIAYRDSVKGLMETAGKKGFTTEKVLNLHTVSHNAEFYAAGRVVRDAEGKVRKFLGPPEIARQIKQDGGGRILVLVPPEFLDQLTESDLVETEVLDNNGELLIAAVGLR